MKRLLLISATILMIMSIPSWSMEYYVSLNGDDTNPGTIEEPFKTLEKARDTIRQLKQDGKFTKPVTVYIRKGMYYRDTPFTLTAEDSGRSTKPIIYTSYEDEYVIISGGTVLEPEKHTWVIHSGSIYETDVSDLLSELEAGVFRSLWVDDERAIRAREPDEGYYYTKSSVPDNQDKAFYFYHGDIDPGWHDLRNVEIQFLREFMSPRMRIDSVDSANDIIWIQGKVIHDFAKFYGGNRYYVVNVFEGLDSPGEWYLDEGSGMLYYWPKDGKDPNTSKFVIPVVGNKATRHTPYLLDIVSNPTDPIQYVRIQNLTFAHSDSYLPACGFYGFTSELECMHGTILEPHWWGHGPAIRIRGRNLVFASNTVKHISGTAIRVHGRNNCIAKNEITDIGVMPLFIGVVSLGDTSGGGWLQSGNNHITDNIIYHVGIDIPAASALYSAIGDHNHIAHNLIYDSQAMGINVGRHEAYGGDNTYNTIEYNHIYDVTKILGDSAALYFVGIQNGTVAQYNKIHDIYTVEDDVYQNPGSHAFGMGGWAVYFDEGGTGVTVRSNWIYRVNRTLMFNTGPGNLICNNVFGGVTYFAFNTGVGFRDSKVRQNIYCNTHVTLRPFSDGQWAWSNSRQGTFDYNLLYNALPEYQSTWDASVQRWKDFDFSGGADVIKQPDGTSKIIWKSGTYHLVKFGYSAFQIGATIFIDDIEYGIIGKSRNPEDDKWDTLVVADGPDTKEDAVYRLELYLDAHSIEADPLFVSLEDDNFNLLSNSPAFKPISEGGIGFEPINMSMVGPRYAAGNPNSPDIDGDINKDSVVNIQDVQACVNHISGTQDWGTRADVNRDGKVNNKDVAEILTTILKQ